MDIVSHGLTGLLVARATTARLSSPAAAAALLGALSPDLDALAKFWDPLAPLSVHRVASHSFLGGIPSALAVAGLVRAVGGGAFWRLAGLAYAGLVSHIVLDAFTPFGAALLWPLDPRRWSVGSLHVIDPTVSLIVVAGLFLSRWWRPPATWVARAGLLALTAYLLLGLAALRIIEARWTQALDRQGTATVRSAVAPVFPGPWRWLGVAETDDSLIRARFWAWSVATSPPTVVRKGSAERGVPAVESHPAVAAFLERARVPWRRVTRDGEAWTIEYEDLAFEDHPFGGPMLLRLRVDRSGAVRVVEFGHRF